MNAITLVLGGARSGKSRYSQELASEFQRVIFIATARANDREMQRKIDAHRAERPRSWQTVEAPLDLPSVLHTVESGADLVLIDCLTLYVANILRTKYGRPGPFESHVQEICQALKRARVPTIVVSNEVGSGIVPTYASGRIYRELLGQLNQEVAKIADRVIYMVAGLPLTVKDVRHS
jgi:adenosylcobinamide kinase / adenosylcobinamide-phosphate guanylyltransferase